MRIRAREEEPYTTESEILEPRPILLDEEQEVSTTPTMTATEVPQQQRQNYVEVAQQQTSFDQALKNEQIFALHQGGKDLDEALPSVMEQTDGFIRSVENTPQAKSTLTGKTVAEERTFDVGKLNYLLKTGASSSILGMMYNQSLPEYDPVREEALTGTEKFLRTVLGFGMDLPAIFTGAAIPSYAARANATLRSYPLLSRIFPTTPKMLGALPPGMAALRQQLAPVIAGGAFSMGFRRFLIDAYENDVADDPRPITERVGRVLKDGLTGGAVGLISGQLQAKRFSALEKSFLKNGGLDKKTLAQIGGSLAGEEVVTAGLIAASEMRLPTKDDFIQAAALGLGLNMVGMYRAPAQIRKQITHKKLQDTFVEYGVHPRTVMDDAQKYADVAEDLLNPATKRIRRYEKAGSNPEPEFYEGSTAVREAEKLIVDQRKKMGLTDPDELYWDADKHSQKMDLLMDLEAFAAKGDAETVPVKKVKLAKGEIVPRDENGVATIPTQKFRMIDGTEVELPVQREHSNALMNQSLFRNVDLVRMYRDLTEGNIPVVADLEPGLWGYYMTPENVWDSSVKNLQKKLRNRATPKVVKDGLRQQLKELKDSRETFIKDPKNNKIVLNREMFQDPATTRLTLTHEIGHLDDWFGGGEIKQFENSVLDNMVGLKQGITQAMEEAVNRKGFDPDLLNDQAVALSMAWRPEEIASMPPNRFRYRMENKAELYADIVSLMIHNPQVVKTQAPEVFRAWETYLGNRPAVRDRMEQMIREVYAGNNLEMASTDLRKGFEEADARYTETLQGSEERKRYTAQEATDNLRLAYDDRMAPVGRRFKTNTELLNKVQRFQGVTTPMANYTKRVNGEVIQYAKSLGASYEDVREVLLHRFIAKDARGKNLPNPLGMDRESSALRLKAFDKTFGKGAAEEIAKRFWTVREQTIVKQIKESGLFSENYLNVVLNSPDYIHRRLVDFVDELGPGYRQLGTAIRGLESELEGARKIRKGSLELIADPLAATMANDARLLYHIKKTVALRDVTMAMQKRYFHFLNANKGKKVSEMVFPDDVDIVLTPDGYTRLTSPEALGHDVLNEVIDRRGMLPGDFEKVSFPLQERGEDGKIHTVRKEFYIPKAVHEAFNAQTLQNEKINKWILNPTRATNRFFRLMVIGANSSFMLSNFLIHDPGRTVFNIPKTDGAFDVLGNSINLAKQYGKTMKAMFRETYKQELDPVYQEMLEKSIVSQGIRFADESTTSSLVDHHLERFMLDPVGRAEEKATREGFINHFGRNFDRVENFFFGIADLTERVGNEAAYRLIKENQQKLGLSDDSVEFITRTQLGSPAYMVKGVKNNVTNTLLPFLNATMQGVKGDLAAIKSNGRMTTAIRVTKMALIPGMVAGLMEAGAFDDLLDNGESETISQQLAKQTEYKKSNRFNIPLGSTETGEGTFLAMRLPRHAMILGPYALGRAIGKAAAEAAGEGDKEGAEIVKEFGSMVLGSTGGFLESQLVAPAPLVTAGIGVGKVLTGGGRDVFGESDWNKTKARPVSYGAPLMASLVAKSLGVNKGLEAMMSPRPRDDFEARSRWGNILNTPFAGPAFSSFFDVTAKGLREEVAKANAKEAVRAAGETIDLERSLNQFFKTGDVSGFPEKYDQKRAKRVLEKMLKQKSKNIYVKNYLEARGKQGKLVAAKRLIESPYWRNSWAEGGEQ